MPSKIKVHGKFRNILEFLSPNDCLVINNTRVIPARLLGKKMDTGGTIEIFLLKDLSTPIFSKTNKTAKKNI